MLTGTVRLIVLLLLNLPVPRPTLALIYGARGTYVRVVRVIYIPSSLYATRVRVWISGFNPNRIRHPTRAKKIVSTV